MSPFFRSVGARGHLGGQDLEGHVAAKLRVGGAVHLARREYSVFFGSGSRTEVRVPEKVGATGRDAFLRVALPGSVPIVMAGLGLGIGRALTWVVIAELFGSTSGLGYAISYHGMLLQTTPMMASLARRGAERALRKTDPR